MRMEGVGMEATEKSKVVIRCAKAALLLSEIKSFPNRCMNCEEYDRFEGDEMLRRKIGELKISLVRERLKTKRIKLCGLMEVVLQVALVLSLSTFFLTLT
ncbi:hypothetical protein I3843_08G045600 [Carya illinoinensis]|uniref:Uncharacterized protein n=1 Tax=Carya illinoinensis TaxID=32201 RepID=A0A922E8Q0_CARIL|nr:hypothetical protein I3842_08G045900 [Carya illinoinensis]KAG7966330.1 hypothetical protein I3843_08G045600 [Carya illinoinensis]